LDAAIINVAVVNFCPYTPFIVRTPAQGSISILTYTGLYVTTYLDYPQLSFEAADGRTFCVLSRRSGNNICGASLTVNGTPDYDQYEINCDP
jgi:hypothetical protein